MSVSPAVQKIAHVQRAIHRFITPLGFRKFGRTHTRRIDDAPVHVIHFQSGQHAFEGKFAINIGVVFPYVQAIETNRELPSHFTEDDCHFTQRLGVLAFQEDRWFDAAADMQQLTDTVTDLLTRFGLPFLDQFGTYHSSIAYLTAHGAFPGVNPHRSALSGAILSHHVGDVDQARAFFATAAESDNGPFREHATKVARRLASTT